MPFTTEAITDTDLDGNLVEAMAPQLVIQTALTQINLIKYNYVNIQFSDKTKQVRI